MEYIAFKNLITIKNVDTLDLKNTLDCGQCFRWSENEDKSFTGVAFGRQITVRKNQNDLILENTNENDFLSFWAEYFDLNTDYKKITGEIAKIHPVLNDAIKKVSGIRILKQEPFEALITFIISQNNNIGRIKGIVSRLCECFGDKICDNVYTFPTAKKLSALSPDDLQPLRAGFRARYIIDAAQKVNNGEVDLEALRTMEFEQAEKELMKIIGVGKKVADCTLLFGLYRIEAFPLDVWMKRAMEKIFTDMTPKDFGEYAGIAQQYIFHYSRTNPDLFKDI